MRKFVLAFTFVFLFFNGYAQTESLPKTLLWRISGNGLKQPSYLFGTMHMQDKRLFNFPDSLYYFMEHVQGFYMEVDPQVTMEKLLTGLYDKDTSVLLRDLVDKKKLDQYAASLEARFGVPVDKINRKQLVSEMLNNKEAGGRKDFPVPMDLWLYNVARRQGKLLGGVEEFNNEMIALSTLVEDSDDSDEEKLGLCVRTYLQSDLEAIDAMTRLYDTGYQKILLHTRNLKMKQSIDSLSALRSCFFAVGAAHLPGSKGLINLLRESGYSVEPVHTSKTLAAENYKFKEIEQPWVQLSNPDSSFSVSVPFRPMPLDMFGKMIPMKASFDAGTNICYLVAETSLYDHSKVDSALLIMTDNMGDNIEKRKKIKLQGHNGYELSTLNGGYYYKGRVIENGENIILQYAYSTTKDALKHPDVARFLNSLNLVTRIRSAEKPAQWITYTDTTHAYSLVFPGKPEQVDQLLKQMKDQLPEQWNVSNLAYADNNSGTIYLSYNRWLANGYYLEDVNSIFETTKVSMQNSSRYVNVSFDSGLYKNYPALWMNGFDEVAKMKVKMVQVVRDNRALALMVIGSEKNLEDSSVNRYLNSLEFLPYKNPTWSLHKTAGSFSILSPFPLQLDTVNSQTSNVYNFSEPASGISYVVEVKPASKYFWAKNEAALDSFYMDMIRHETDSVVAHVPVQNRQLKGFQYDILRNRSVLWRYRILHSADSLYILYTMGSPGFVTKYTSAYFESFVADAEPVKDVYANKTTLLLSDYLGKDSVLATEADNYIPNAVLLPAQLPELHNAFLRSRQFYDSADMGSHATLALRVAAMNDPSTVRFIETNYDKLKENKQELEVYHMLARMHSKESYQLLKTLFVKNKPQVENIFFLSYVLTDSLQLAKQLFPDILVLMKDSNLVRLVVPLANKLIDSGLLLIDDLKPYYADFINQASKNEHTIAEDENPWNYRAWFNLLAQIKTAPARELLTRLQGSESMKVAFMALSAAVASKNELVKPAIENLAANEYYRVDIYNILKDAGKISQFPVKWLNQRSLFQSALFNYLEDEGDVYKTEYIAERVRQIDGKQLKFYLFKVYIENEDPVLGIIGGIPAGSKTLFTEAEHIGFGTDVYTPSRIDQELDDFLLRNQKN